MSMTAKSCLILSQFYSFPDGLSQPGSEMGWNGIQGVEFG